MAEFSNRCQVAGEPRSRGAKEPGSQGAGEPKRKRSQGAGEPRSQKGKGVNESGSPGAMGAKESGSQKGKGAKELYKGCKIAPQKKVCFSANFALLAGFFLVSVLLSASVERCLVSRMRDFFY